MSEKVVIPKWLSDEIECLKEFNDNLVEDVMYVLLEKHSFRKHNLTLVDLARAIEEGYEVEKEYLTLEQVMELEAGTILKHEKYCFPTEEFRVHLNCYLQYRNNNKEWKVKEFNRVMLEPKWYVVN